MICPTPPHSLQSPPPHKQRYHTKYDQLIETSPARSPLSTTAHRTKMKGTLKRPVGNERPDDSTLEKLKPPHTTTTTTITVEDYLDDDSDISAGWSRCDDETLQELRKLLELEDEVVGDEEAEKQGHQRTQSEPLPLPPAVKFISNPYSSLSRPLILSSPYITINGNEESCGSSISDSDSSVMASVDVGTFNYSILNPLNPHHPQGPQPFLGVSGSGDIGAGYTFGTMGSAEDEMTRGWLMEEGIWLRKNGGQAVIGSDGGGACGSEEKAVVGLYVETVNKSAGSDCLAWDNEALARFIGEEEADQGVDHMVFGY